MACLSFCRCKLYGLVSISNQTVLSNAKRSHFCVGAVGAIPARSARRADSYKHTIQCTGRVERRNCPKPFSDFRKLGGSSSWGTRRRVSRSWKAAAAIPRRADWQEISMRRRFPSSLHPIPFTGRQEKIDAFANEGRQLLFQGFRLMPQ